MPPKGLGSTESISDVSPCHVSAQRAAQRANMVIPSQSQNIREQQNTYPMNSGSRQSLEHEDMFPVDGEEMPDNAIDFEPEQMPNVMNRKRYASCSSNDIHTHKGYGESDSGGENLDSDQDQEVEQDVEAARSKALAQPLLPTTAEVEAHNVSHLPFRSWCPHCVRGRGPLMESIPHSGYGVKKHIFK